MATALRRFWNRLSRLLVMRALQVPVLESLYIAYWKRRRVHKIAPNSDYVVRMMSRPAPRRGDAAPDFTLSSPDGRTSVTLSKLWQDRPVVLVFGSFT